MAGSEAEAELRRKSYWIRRRPTSGAVEGDRHIDLAKESLEEATLVVKLPALIHNRNESYRGRIHIKRRTQSYRESMIQSPKHAGINRERSRGAEPR